MIYDTEFYMLVSDIVISIMLRNMKIDSKIIKEILMRNQENPSLRSPP